jgi:hypothetical protein
VTVRDCAAALTLGFLVLAARPASADSPCDGVVKALRGANSYEAVLIARNGNTTGLQATTDIEKPSSIHVIEPKMEMIGIGSKGWMRINGGAWQSTPVTIGNLASMDPSKFLKSKGTPTCVDAGMGAWHGQPVHIYKETYTTPDGSTGNATLYVGTNGFIRHEDFETSKVSGSEDFSKFNAVTIAPP